MTVLSKSETKSSNAETNWPFPFSKEDWEATPKAVQDFLSQLHQRLNQNSSNSNRPPASDPPFRKPSRTKDENAKKKSGAKKGHAGHGQTLMTPTEVRHVLPGTCPCGNSGFPETKPFHTHQVIELPEIEMDVIHHVLHQGICPACDRLIKSVLPAEHRTGYGPRLTALIGEMSGIQGGSRRSIKEFCSSVLGFHLSVGTIQKVIDRVSDAINPHYEALGTKARSSAVNFIDETSWFLKGKLMWLWLMANTSVAFYLIHPRRSKEAFAALIEDWAGILVSDGYGVYQKWVNLRQTCLAHLIRKAKSLAASSDPEIAACGRWARDELRRLCRMAKDPPTVGEWRAFYARLSRLINTNHDRKDEAGKFARRLLREMDSIWIFLEVEGVEPTNNRAERAARFGVLWRKRSQGTDSDKGNRWVERILSLRETCRIREIPSFLVLVDAVQAKFQDRKPDLSWI